MSENPRRPNRFTHWLASLAGKTDRPAVLVKALGKRDRRRMLKHFLALDTSDRLLRFGTVLPDDGVTYYDMPTEYRARPGYRYTVVNKQPVLVDRSRRIVDAARAAAGRCVTR